jgi:hypothetical protein
LTSAGDRFEFFDREDENTEDEEIEFLDNKCNYPDCKNYGDGSVDKVCESCDNYNMKEESHTENFSDIEQAAVKITEELLGKPLNVDEKNVLKDCLNCLNKLFEQAEKNAESKKFKK